MEEIKFHIPDFSITKFEQIRDQNNKSRIAWVNDGGIKDVQTNIFRCNICDTVEHYDTAHPIFCNACRKKSTFTPFTPTEIEELWMPYGIEPYEPPLDDLPKKINKFIDDHLCLRDYNEVEVLTRWIISSYRQDDFNFAPYLQFIGPIESGKTRALEMIKMLAYRGLLHAYITPSALCRELTMFHPTVCIDQAEQIFNMKNERGAEMYAIFMSGYKSDQKYMVASKESDNGLIARKVFGFKAIASTRIFDEALASRSIIFKMKEGKPKIEEIGEESIKEAQHIRNQLLYWRLCQEQLSKVDHPEIKGRLKEIYTPLLRIKNIFSWNDNDLVDFIRIDEIEKEKEMSDTFEAEILRNIKDLQEDFKTNGKIDSPTRIVVKQLSEDPKERRKIGYKLKAMNIERKHSSEGNYIDLEDEKTVEQLKYLFKHFHIDRNQGGS